MGERTWYDIERHVIAARPFMPLLARFLPRNMQELAQTILTYKEGVISSDGRCLVAQYFVEPPSKDAALPSHLLDIYEEFTVASEKKRLPGLRKTAAQLNYRLHPKPPYGVRTVEYAVTEEKETPFYRPKKSAIVELLGRVDEHVPLVKELQAYQNPTWVTAFSNTTPAMDLRIAAQVGSLLRKGKSISGFGDIPPGKWIEKNGANGLVDRKDGGKFDYINIEPQAFWRFTTSDPENQKIVIQIAPN